MEYLKAMDANSIAELIRTVNVLLSKHIPFPQSELGLIKFQYNVYFKFYKIRLDRVESLMKKATNDGRTVEILISDQLSKYNKLLNERYKKCTDDIREIKSVSKLVDLNIDDTDKQIVMELIEFDLSLMLSCECLEKFLNIAEMLIELLEENELADNYRDHCLTNMEHLNIIEYLDQTINRGKIKYMLIYHGEEHSNFIKDDIKSIEMKLHRPVDPYIEKYVMLSKILNFFFSVLQYEGPEIITDPESLQDNEVIANYRSEMILMEKVINQYGFCINDYEPFLADGPNFKSYIWKYNKFHISHTVYSPIYHYFKEYEFAKTYIKYHKNLSKLLENISSKSFERDLLLNFITLPCKHDTKKIALLKSATKQMDLTSINSVDCAIFSTYWCHPKTLVWLAVMEGKSDESIKLDLSDRLQFLCSNEVLDVYIHYYESFVKLLKICIDSRYMP